jgi:hypothetical protein
MVAKPSTGRGMRVVYRKEGIDPRKCHAVYCTAAHHGQRAYQLTPVAMSDSDNRTDTREYWRSLPYMYNWLVAASPGIVDRDCQE